METQEQEVEAFKKWWNENGKVVVLGVVGGLSAVIGWNAWQAHGQRQAEVASSLYAEVVNAHNAQQYTQALGSAKSIQEQYPESGYAALAALVGAGSAYASNATDEAKGQLLWVIENAEVSQVKDVARLRLARVLGAEGKFDQANSNLDGITADSFKGVIAELRGDFALANNERDKAITAYEGALELEDLDASSLQRIQVKLSDLGVQPKTQ